MNKWLELLVGLILVIVTILLTVSYPESWGAAALSFIMGGIVIGVILVGLLFLVLGISDLKE
jgi:hypothetical protein